MRMKISIHDVANRAGVSVVTVSRVLNNAPSVREKNRQKVMQAVKELNYKPNAAARSLVSGKTGIIGLWLPSLQDDFFDAVVRKINDLLAEQGYLLVLSIAAAENGELNFLEEEHVDGVILLAPFQEDDRLLELKRLQLPFVVLNGQNNHPSASTVTINHYKGGYEAARHLIELGHTRISLVNGPKMLTTSKECEKGFRFALEEAGIVPYAVEYGTNEVKSGYDIAQRWLIEDKLPSAVFAVDDYMALGVVGALKNSGLQIPRDLSVVGYANRRIAADFYPDLSTVSFPAEEIGSYAVELLIRGMNSTLKRNTSVECDPQLVIRHSTIASRGEVNRRGLFD